MEFSQDLKTVFDKLKDSKGYVLLDESTLYKYTTDELEDLLDLMGELSRKARGMAHSITSAVKFTTNQVIYLKTEGYNVIGFAKVQRSKKLFKPDGLGGMNEIKLTAILDFYIHPNYEMKGHGKQLFEHIVKTEHFPGSQVGIYKINKNFVSFINRAFKNKCPVKHFDDDFHIMHKSDEFIDVKPKTNYATLNKNISQTNLGALSSATKPNIERSRSNIFNSIGKDVITQNTYSNQGKNCNSNQNHLFQLPKFRICSSKSLLL